MPHSAPANSELTPPLSLSIVALDDDADFRQFLEATLGESGEGHDLRVAASAADLYAHIEDRMPDIALVDMKMGRESGEEVIDVLRSRWPRLCIIVVTGYPSLDSMRQTFKRDVFDYLAKPFSIVELRRTLAQAAAAFDLGIKPQDRLRHELGKHIRLARTEKGLTLKDLSETCGVSVSQLSSIERGSHLPSLESLLAVAQALDAKPSEWLMAAGL